MNPDLCNIFNLLIYQEWHIFTNVKISPYQNINTFSINKTIDKKSETYARPTLTITPIQTWSTRSYLFPYGQRLRPGFPLEAADD